MIHGGSVSKKQSSRTCFYVFSGPAKQVFNDLGARKMFHAAECLKKMIVADMD